MASSPRFAFFGTDAFSVGVLDALEAAGLTPAVIVAAPDRPAGRGMEVQEPATKAWGKARGIPVAQPEKPDDVFASKLRAAGPWDCFAVASYGKIIPASVLDVPAKGSLNVHPSLLPAHRGATPIEAAMLADEKATGVSVILMDAKMDHGPIVAAKNFRFAEWPTRREVEAALASQGGELLAEVLPRWVAGEIEAREQDHAAATYTKKLEKADGDLALCATEREKFLRTQTMNPWPGAFFVVDRDGKPMRVKVAAASWDEAAQRCVFERVVPEGRGEMDWTSFRNGFLQK